MERELQSTLDKTKDLEKRGRQQESRQRELDTLKATTDRLLTAKKAQVDDLQMKNDANKSTDFTKHSKDLFMKNQEKTAEVDKLFKKV